MPLCTVGLKFISRMLSDKNSRFGEAAVAEAAMKAVYPLGVEPKKKKNASM